MEFVPERTRAKVPAVDHDSEYDNDHGHGCAQLAGTSVGVQTRRLDRYLALLDQLIRLMDDMEAQ